VANRHHVAGVDPEALGIRGELEPGERARAAARGILQLLGDFVEVSRDLEGLASGEQDRGGQSLTSTATS
jgi:hypothetical protein